MCAAYWVQTGNGITRLKAPSNPSRDVPSLTISVGVPIKPWSSPPHRSRAISRDFVHWCFSYACRQRVRMGSSCRRPKSFTGTAVSECRNVCEQTYRTLLDHLVSGGEEGRRNSEAKRPGVLEIDRQLEFC